MHDLVASIIATSGKENYERLLFVKYGFLRDSLRKAGPVGQSVANYVERNLTPLEALTGEVLVRKGTPFFWMNVFRCRSDGRDNGMNLESYSRHLVMLAFDSYFEHLPDARVLPF
jgi:hypothetical protein